MICLELRTHRNHPAHNWKLITRDMNARPFLVHHCSAPAFLSRLPASCSSNQASSSSSSSSSSIWRICCCAPRRSISSNMSPPNNRKPKDLVVVYDPVAFQKKKEAIRNAGVCKLQVIVDFDGTLTKYRISGVRGQTSHGLLQQGDPRYDNKRKELYDHYHPLEISPTIPLDQKATLMEEWWEKTHALLVEGGLTYKDIQRSVSNSLIEFREGTVELFELLEEKGVPVLIFSAGLADIIEEVLRQKLHRSFKNIKVVSNRMVFDSNGSLLGFKGKTIHVLNKNEHALDMAAPLHETLGGDSVSEDDLTMMKSRVNVLLLGDHIGDLGMSDGLKYENHISVGFLNDNVEESLEVYKQAFDMVLLNDSPMHGVVDLAAQLCSPAYHVDER